jgi:4'-phosphopantetheinyl transferase
VPPFQLFTIDLLRPLPGEDFCLLSPDEQARAERFCFEADRRRFIRARCALRRTLGESLGRFPESVVFVYGPSGKPELKDQAVHFNLSHSGDCAVIALCETHAIGIDIEQFKQNFEPLELAKSVFTESEQASLAAVPIAARHAAFFSAWTQKEAMIKCDGAGFSSPWLRHTVWPEPEPLVQQFFDIRSEILQDIYFMAVATRRNFAPDQRN